MIRLTFLVLNCLVLSSLAASALRDGDEAVIDEPLVEEDFAPAFVICDSESSSAEYIQTCDDICGPDSCQHWPHAFGENEIPLTDICLCDKKLDQVPAVYTCSHSTLNETFQEDCDITCDSIFSEETQSYTSLFCSLTSSSEGNDKCICIPYDEDESDDAKVEADIVENLKGKKKKKKKKRPNRPGQPAGSNGSGGVVISEGSEGSVDVCNRITRKSQNTDRTSLTAASTNNEKGSGRHCQSRACVNVCPLSNNSGNSIATVGGAQANVGTHNNGGGNGAPVSVG